MNPVYYRIFTYCISNTSELEYNSNLSVLEFTYGYYCRRGSNRLETSTDLLMIGIL